MKYVILKRKHVKAKRKKISHTTLAFIGHSHGLFNTMMGIVHRLECGDNPDDLFALKIPN